MRRARLAWPAGTALAAVAASLLAAMGRDDPVLGQDAMQTVLQLATIVFGALTAVLLLGWVLSGVAGAGINGFQRALLYGLLSGTAIVLILRWYGFDLTAVLTTSAILTAAVGLALQPLLTTMIAGLAVQMDRLVRPGDGLRHDGELVRVLALNWRSVVAQRGDGTIVVLPNSNVANQITEIIPSGQPVRIHTCFFAPQTVSPQRVATLVTEMVSDFALVDAQHPIAVGPTSQDPERGAIRYTIRYNVMEFDRSDVLETEVLRRLWYVFQRNRISLPDARPFGALRSVGPVIESAVLADCTRAALARGGAAGLGLAAADTDRAPMLLAGARVLMYAPDERLVLPEETADWRFLLVRGEALVAHEYGLDQADARRSALPSFCLGPDAMVRQVAERLAVRIGPYAEIAVRRAARSATGVAELCRVVAEEIADPTERTRFLAEAEPAEAPRYGPGLVFRARRNAAGSLISHLALRAACEVAVLALPPALLATEATSGTAGAAHAAG